MVLIRLAHAADLPTPDELIEKLKNQPAPAALPSDGGGAYAPAGNSGGGAPARARLASAPQREERSAPAPETPPAPQIAANPNPQNYAELVALAGEKRDLVVKHALEAFISPVSFAEGRIEVALTEDADQAIISTLSARLKTWTGRPWMVIVSTKAPPAPTLRQTREAAEKARLDAAHDDPLVQAVLETFPGAKVVNVRVRDEEPPLPAPEDVPLDPDADEDDEL